jgi:hypothetical protein
LPYTPSLDLTAIDRTADPSVDFFQFVDVEVVIAGSCHVNPIGLLGERVPLRMRA